MLSDGYGGAHALLFGVASFNSSEPNRYILLGNIYDGVRPENLFRERPGSSHRGVGTFRSRVDGQKHNHLLQWCACR